MLDVLYSFEYASVMGTFTLNGIRKDEACRLGADFIVTESFIKWLSIFSKLSNLLLKRLFNYYD